jgi:UDP-glucose 4-epimerase
MDKVLITGICGHIGSYMLGTLPNYSGIKIIGVDNMLTQRYSSLMRLGEDTNLTFIEDDFLNVDIPEGCTVIHLAAITNAADSMNNKDEMERINVDMTKQFIDKCIDAKVKQFIFPSSTSVYGVASDVVTEDDPKFENPQSPYAESKLTIERYLESKTDELTYTILRFGTIYGWSKGMRFHTAINKFCWLAATGRPITVWKENYEQVRPYLGLSDAAAALRHVMFNDIPRNTKYNVLSANYKLCDLVDLIKRHKPDLEINMVDTPLLNQYSYNVSDDKIKSTGLRTMWGIDDVIENMLNRILQNLY